LVASTDPVSDDLWEAIEPLLPPEPSRQHGGPPRVTHRAALGGILFILRHGLRWGDLPHELGYGSGVTCWRRLRQWADARHLGDRAPGHPELVG
jgi:transposase